MRCVIAVAQYQFEDTLRLFNPPQFELHQAIVGEPSPDAHQGQTLPVASVFNLTNEHARVIVQPKSWGVVHQGNGSLTDHEGALRRYFARGKQFFAGAKVTRLGVRTQWIQPVDEPWDRLVGRFKRQIAQTSTDVDEAADIAVVLEFNLGAGLSSRVQFGPMKRQQLVSQYLLVDDLVDAPDRMFFLDVDYYWTPDRAKAENSALLDKTIAAGMKYADEYGRRLVGQLDGGEHE